VREETGAALYLLYGDLSIRQTVVQSMHSDLEPANKRENLHGLIINRPIRYGYGSILVRRDQNLARLPVGFGK
jgi:hypothetical protein